MKQQLNKSTWIAIAGVTVLFIILMVTNPNALWVVLSVPFVLFVPGFALTLILFPQKSLGIAERLLVSVALSLAFTALAGLLLGLSPWGLQTKSLWITFLVAIVVETVVLYLRRPTSRSETTTTASSLNFNTRQWVLMARAALMTIMAVRVARTPAPQQGLEGYTLLWVQKGDTPSSIHLGVESEEFQETRYQIRYEYNGTTREGPAVKLKPGETWEKVVPIPVTELAGNSFSILLYRLDNPNQVYRRVVWWPQTP